MKFPTSKCMKDLQSFLHLASYFRKFIYGYWTIARPWTSLLKYNIKFKFEKDEEQTFRKLNHALSSKPILKLYKVGTEMELHTDVSKFGFGVILMQEYGSDNTFDLSIMLVAKLLRLKKSIPAMSLVYSQ